MGEATEALGHAVVRLNLATLVDPGPSLSDREAAAQPGGERATGGRCQAAG